MEFRKKALSAAGVSMRPAGEISTHENPWAETALVYAGAPTRPGQHLRISQLSTGHAVTDIVSPTRRSEMMRRIRAKGTKPELIVRSTVHRLGHRFRLHVKDLPGSPDLVFPGRRLVLFVHGCFWHRHRGCSCAYRPKSNIAFWEGKFKSNVARDKRVVRELEEMGWRVAIVWECETANPEGLREELKKLLRR